MNKQIHFHVSSNDFSTTRVKINHASKKSPWTPLKHTILPPLPVIRGILAAVNHLPETGLIHIRIYSAWVPIMCYHPSPTGRVHSDCPGSWEPALSLRDLKGQDYIDELVQERCNSSALAMELHLSCIDPLTLECHHISFMVSQIIINFPVCLTVFF